MFDKKAKQNKKVLKKLLERLGLRVFTRRSGKIYLFCDGTKKQPINRKEYNRDIREIERQISKLTNIVEELKEMVEEEETTNPKLTCPECGGSKSRNAKLCRECWRKSIRK